MNQCIVCWAERRGVHCLPFWVRQWRSHHHRLQWPQHCSGSHQPASLPSLTASSPATTASCDDRSLVPARTNLCHFHHLQHHCLQQLQHHSGSHHLASLLSWTTSQSATTAASFCLTPACFSCITNNITVCDNCSIILACTSLHLFYHQQHHCLWQLQHHSVSHQLASVMAAAASGTMAPFFQTVLGDSSTVWNHHNIGIITTFLEWQQRQLELATSEGSSISTTTEFIVQMQERCEWPMAALSRYVGKYKGT